LATLLHRAGYYTGMWGSGTRSDPAASTGGKITARPGRVRGPDLYTATGETTYTGRYATDVITDLAIDF